MLRKQGGRAWNRANGKITYFEKKLLVKSAWESGSQIAKFGVQVNKARQGPHIGKTLLKHQGTEEGGGPQAPHTESGMGGSWEGGRTHSSGKEPKLSPQKDEREKGDDEKIIGELRLSRLLQLGEPLKNIKKPKSVGENLAKG